MLERQLASHRAAKRRQYLRTVFLRLAVWAAGLAGAVTFVYLLIFGWRGSYFIAHPKPFPFPDRPENYGLSCERVEFPAAVDSVRIAGWLFGDPASQGRLVIVVPGFRNHKAALLREYLRWLVPAVGVLAIDPRSAGESGPALCSYGQDERRDVAGAVAFAQSRGYGRIMLWGTSLGGAAVIAEGSEDPRVRAVAADGAPASMQLGLESSFRIKGYPLPGLAARSVILGLSFQIGHPLGDGDAVLHVRQLSPRPLLLIHGAKDRVIPLANELALAAAADPAHTAVLTFPDAGHLSDARHSPHYLHPAVYQAAVLELVHRALDR